MNNEKNKYFKCFLFALMLTSTYSCRNKDNHIEDSSRGEDLPQDIDTEVNEFLTSLPSNTIPLANFQQKSSDQQVWRKFFGVGEYLEDKEEEIEAEETDTTTVEDTPIVYGPPNVKPILSRALYHQGVRIKEFSNQLPKNQIGRAVCIDGNPVIFYANNLGADIRLTNENFVFFREHEFAHIKLGHPVCSKTETGPQARKRELDADLEAAKTLINEFGEDGEDVVHRAVGTFLGMGLSSSSTHPSSKERAKAIDEYYKN